MSGNKKSLSVLILAETAAVGSSVEQVVSVLGHSPDWRTYESAADMQRKVATGVWDLVVIEGCEAVEDLKIPLIAFSSMKLRLLFEDARVVIIATGRAGADVSGDAESLLNALSRVVRHAASVKTSHNT
jgi:hypothetical protein